MRRQNHSCDPCRKSKKACDGYLLNSIGRHPAAYLANSSGGREYSDKGVFPCTYCYKTKKQCPLNPYWTAAKDDAEEFKPSAAAGASNAESAQSKRRRMEDEARAMMSPSFIVPKGVDLSANILQMLETPAPGVDPFGWVDPLPSLESQPDFTGHEPLESFFTPVPPIGPVNPRTKRDDLSLHALESDSGHQPSIDSGFQSTNFSDTQSSRFDTQTPMWDLSQDLLGLQDAATDEQNDDNLALTSQRRTRRRQRSPDWQVPMSSSRSPFEADSVIVSTSNNSMITESLLRIYHDVLENNLACWLSEETCPYKMNIKSNRLHVRSQALITTEFAPAIPQVGSIWPNRMYSRVMQLDKVAQATGMIHLTRAESRAASKALDLVIMAFATQWAQGNRRRERYRPNCYSSLGSSPEDMANSFSEEFERNLQQTIWEQAKKALQDVSEIESYRVIYAELIFGLTLKPWADDDYEPKSTKSIRRLGKSKASKKMSELVLPEVMDIISKEGPPIYMHRATHKIHALKFRLDANETGFLKTKHLETNPNQKVTTGDRRTIGLLYWLAVMFDTVASSMSERPVVLADEECQHDGDDELEAPNDKSALKADAGKWKLDMFAQDDPEKPTTTMRWPCPEDVARKGITKSAPVKILIYRHLSYLQNALRKRQYGQPVEDVIQSVTRLYRYWNMTHGAFFRDLVRSYPTVPATLKVWFICIAVPWHLGVLMVADLIDFVDQNALGLEEATLKRIDSNMTTRIRKASAMDLSDLAGITTPNVDDLSGNPNDQLPDFHFSLTEGPLLTEPWSIILIRAFAQASVYYLGVADDLRQHELDIFGHESEELQDSLKRADNCVRALWCLGKKSEMARNVTKVLSEALEMQRE